MMRPRTWFAFAACSLLFAAAPEAHANGRFPQSNALEVSPFDPATFVLRTTFGIMFSHDKGKSWKWICETAVADIRGDVDPSIGILKNRFIAGTLKGLSSSTDNGCSWKTPDTTSVVDVVTRPNQTSSALILQSASLDSGLVGFENRVLETTDDGATYKALTGAIASNLYVETIEVAASDPARIYVSARAFDSAGNQHGYILTSKDSGAHYTNVELPLVDGEEAPFISAVDPKNADILYIRTGATIGDSPKQGSSWLPALPTRLVVSTDGGATFKTVYQAKNVLLGFALSADGSKVYVGGPNDGLQVASTADFEFKQTSPIHVLCLRKTADALYACSDEKSGFLLGTSTDDGAHFDGILHLACTVSADTFLSCAAGTSAATCSQPNQDQFGGQSPLDFLGETNRTGYDDPAELTAICSGTPFDAGTGTGIGDAGTRKDSGTSGDGVVGPGGNADAGSGNGATSSGSGDSGGCSTAGPFAWTAAAGNVLAVGAVAAFLRKRRRR